MHLKTIENKIISKKAYNKPEVTQVALDSSITLIMMKTPGNPVPRGDSNKGKNEPFQSPFGDKPFG